MKYITTKRQCQKQVDKYKNVCCGCGRKLSPIETVDNSNNPTFWSGCIECGCFDNGTTIKIHKIAKKMVIERYFRAYRRQEPDKDINSKEYNYWLTSQIRGTCGIVYDILAYNEIKNLKCIL